MTFLEAAIELLKREGKPLSSQRLAQLAVEQRLLSVVGRDPEGMMEERLTDFIDKHPHGGDLFRLRPGIYGLRNYPERPAVPAEPSEVAVGEAPKPEPKIDGKEAGVAPSGEESHEGKRLRRRGRPEAEADEQREEEPGEKEAKRRRRRRGRGERHEERAEAHPPLPKDERGAEPEETRLSEAEKPRPAMESIARDAASTEEELGELDFESGPLLAPTHGEEELTRTGEERAVRTEILGRREERDRRRERERKGPRARKNERPRVEEPPQQPERMPPPLSTAPPVREDGKGPQEPAGALRDRGLVGLLVDLLRSSDGRPVHLRSLLDLAVRRRLLEGRSGQPQDLLRELRNALMLETRQREAEGLRSRVRNLGSGHFAAQEVRRFDSDLAAAERDLKERATRLRDLTKVSLRRRLQRMAPAAFEALLRSLCERMGIAPFELLRRGEGFAYFGGVRSLGIGTQRVLVAIRPGDVEMSRRAVGELRAGLEARGYDEGLLFCAGRPSQEALAELKTGGGVVAFDGAQLAALLIKHGIGVRRLYLPVDYLDLELIAELSD